MTALVVTLVGAALMVAGFALVSVPVGMIVCGIFVAILGLFALEAE